MPVYRLTFAYDGTGFRGYAAQPGLRTVQGCLDEMLGRLVGPMETEVAGRTDAGVHARANVLSFEGSETLDPVRLVRALNRMLPPEIAVADCREAPEGFSARFSATSRTYRYYLFNRAAPDPLRRLTSWHVPEPVDLGAMDEAAGGFVGQHDFSSFCRAAKGRSLVREVSSAAWEATEEPMLRFEITAGSFCHQMVRSLVALCVEVGRGRIVATAVPAIITARNRSAAGGVAPAHGLVLWDVRYEECGWSASGG